MSKFIGRRGALGIAVEATRGTALPPVYYVPYNSISIDDKVERARENAAFANIADSEASFVTSKWAEGDFEADMYDKSVGAVLYAVFGTLNSAAVGGDATVYDHTFTLANTNQHKSLSVAYQDPNKAVVYPMSMVEEFKLIVEPKGIVKYSVSFKGKPKRDWTTLTTDYTSLGNKFLHQHLSFKVAANLAGLAAATAIDVKKLELTIKKEVELEDIVGTVAPTDIVNKAFGVEGQIVIDRNDETFKDYWLANDTYKAVEIKLTSPTLIGNTSYPTLTIQMPRVDFNEWEQDRALDDLVTETISFKANYDATNADNQIDSCVLRNLVASY